MSESALNGIPAGGLTGSANGVVTEEVPFTVLAVVAVLETPAEAGGFFSTPGLSTTSTTGSAAVSWRSAPSPTRDRVTVAGVPLLPATVNEPVAGPAADGAKVTCTLIDSPGLIVLPTAGRPVALNGAAGGVTEVTVWVVVPRLAIVTTSGLPIPSGTGTTPWSGASGNVCALGCGARPSWVPSPATG